MHVHPVFYMMILFLLLPVMANLSSNTFGKDDYTSLLSGLSVADDWKNVIGQNLYRNMIIHNREFANVYNNITFPDIPTSYDYQRSYIGKNKYTSYNLTASVELLLCIDKGLASKCSYTTRLNVDMQSGTAKRIYSVVKYNNERHSLSSWYDNQYSSSSTTMPGSDMLLTPTGLIDTAYKRAIPLSSIETCYNNSNMQDCQVYSNLTYAASVADNNIYPISPQCFINYMKSYANPASNFDFPTVACNNVSYAVYEDPGFIAGGPLVLEIYNVWNDLNVAIAGYNTPTTSSPAVTNIDYLPNSILHEYYLLYKTIDSTYNRSNIANYTDATRILNDTVNQAISKLYRTNNIDPGLDYIVNFTVASTRNVFVHTSTNAARYLAERPFGGEVTKLSNLLGSRLGNVVPQYIKTRQYCLHPEETNFNSTVLLDPLTVYAADVTTGRLSADIGRQWSTNFALLLTSWVVAAAAPPVLYRKGCKELWLSVAFIVCIIIGTVVAPYMSYKDAVSRHLHMNATLTNTDTTAEGYVIVATIRTEYTSKIRTSLKVLGYTLPPFVFIFVASLGYFIDYLVGR